MYDRKVCILVIIITLIMSISFIIGCYILGNFIFKGLLNLGSNICQGMLNL